MDARQQEALVQRLVQNPQDQGAIAEAHAAGQQDPEGYARLLEQVGMSTPSPSVACHWLNEAANVWETTFQDTARTISTLVVATERDPTSETTVARVANLYRSTNDLAGLAVAMTKRAAAMAEFARREPDWLPKAASLYEELGRFCAEPPVEDTDKAKEAYGRAVDLDPTSAFAIYSLRELHKAAGEFAEALPYFGMELALVTDSARKLALYLDEAEVAKAASRTDRAISALRHAQRIDANNPTLRQQLATLILERYRAGQSADEAERNEGSELFVSLAEAYPGEHGFLYALCALELNSRHDRAMQLALYFGEQLGRLREAAPLAAAYVRDNPQGVMAQQAKDAAGDAVPPPVPKSASAGRPSQEAAPAVAAKGPQRPASAQRSTSAAPPAGISIDDLLERAAELAKRSRKNEAIAVYRQVLDLDPVNPDALNYLLEQLPIKRKYADLKDVLLGAIDCPEALEDDRLGWLRDLASMSETQLRDVDTAVYSWQRILEIEPDDDEARDQVKRLLEKGRRWDELAEVLRAEADNTEDEEVRISLEKNLAKMHATRRKDPAAAGEAWARIAALSPGDEAALQEAVKFFEKAQRSDLAADVIAENVAALDDDLVKRELYLRLGSIRAAQGQPLLAAEALAEGADDLGDAEMWNVAEGYFVEAQAWEPAAGAADEQAALADSDEQKAEILARAASYLRNDGDTGEAVSRLEAVVALAPTNDEYSQALEELLVAADRVDELVQMFLTRAAALDDVEARVVLRKRAAASQRDRLGDVDAARGSYALVLQDKEDAETLQWLATEAEERGDADTAVSYLMRLTDATTDEAAKIEIALHQADLCATRLKDVEQAAERYEFILEQLDDKNEAALEQLGDLEIARGEYQRGAEYLERYLAATGDRAIKLATAARLAEMYELNLDRQDEAIRLLSFIHQEDPEDVDATRKLCDLAEEAEQWGLVADLTAELIGLETQLPQISEMTRRLADILHTKLDNGGEAMNVLGVVADRGDQACREAYIELGDSLDQAATVARRIVAWHQNSGPSDERDDALHAAFDRFVDAGQSAEAVAVAKTLVAGGGASPDIAETFENLAVELNDLEALAMAHELRAAALSGLELAAERVRQAEVLVGAGVPEEQAVLHGEQALSEVLLSDVGPLLARLAALCGDPSAKVDVYEREIARLAELDERLIALCRAAAVAVELGDEARARLLLDAPLAAGLDEEPLELMITQVREADEAADSTVLRRNLVEALANGGHGARDGGRTRGRLLRVAASIAQAELGDLERAFQWLGDGLVLNVEDAALDVVEEIAGRVGDYARAEAVLGRGLDEVFDGPLVRRLLARRAQLRQERMDDLEGAAADLKRLHELSPSDKAVNDKLVSIYETLGEHRGIVALLEDQILRNRDKELRAQLSRRVAKLWQGELDDPREAADAWRRVLRLAPGDEEAKEGLAQAKEAMLRAKAARAEAEVVDEEPPASMPSDSSDEAAAADAPAEDDEPPSAHSEEGSDDEVLPPSAPDDDTDAADDDTAAEHDDSAHPAAVDDDGASDADDEGDYEANRDADGLSSDDDFETGPGAAVPVAFDSAEVPEDAASDESTLDEPHPAWGQSEDEIEEPTGVLDPSELSNPMPSAAEQLAAPAEQALFAPDEHMTPGDVPSEPDNALTVPLDEHLPAADDFEAATEVFNTGTMAAAANQVLAADEPVELDDVEEIDDVLMDEDAHLGAPPPKPPPRRGPPPRGDRPVPPPKHSGAPAPSAPLAAGSAEHDDS